jgi:hypothetical protein
VRHAYVNFGAEEGDGLPAIVEGSPLHRLEVGFRRMVDAPPVEWPWLRAATGLVPWMSTPAAAAAARRLGVPSWGATPAVVRRVHDKAFAVRAVRAVPVDPDVDPLRGLVVILAPAVLASIRAAERVEDIVGRWPPWARASFTLKPRFGTSGRGRLAGRDGMLPPGARGAALSRLSRRGGAILEPWLARVDDFSSLWWIGDDGATLLGCTRQIVRPSGVYLGCDVVREADGCLGSGAGTDVDAALAAAARPVVEQAARVGLRGPCGVDAFTWRHLDGAVRLRGVVELNARFTAGHVALATALRPGAAGTKMSFRLDRGTDGAPIGDPLCSDA